jgi:DNA-directed RNA polymerase specialized sigma24 family protein
VSVPAQLDEALTVAVDQVDAVDALDLDRALTKLEALDPDQARIVEMRFFGGLTIEETAAALSLSPSTVKREWAIAKGWLFRELTGARHPAEPA